MFLLKQKHWLWDSDVDVEDELEAPVARKGSDDVGNFDN